jgi:hypothetical protein
MARRTIPRFENEILPILSSLLFLRQRRHAAKRWPPETVQQGLLLLGRDNHQYSMISTGKAMIFDAGDSAMPYPKPDNLS